MPASEHASLGQKAERYWVESRRPLASLIFIAPLLAVYELGVLLLGVQNGADAFMRSVLDSLGFGQHFVLPFLTICILLAWHYLSREPWSLSGRVISAMAAESIILGVCLRLVLFLQDAVCRVFNPQPVLMNIGDTLKEGIGFLGAGIYEELLFRLILFSLAAWALRRAGLKPRWSTVAAVILTSLLFAAMHYRVFYPGGDAFSLFTFSFRFLAGVLFSVIFIYRGFGIVAGSHAAYDVLAWLWG
jgi:membrane protease YdiL (CAAX protease family)